MTAPFVEGQPKDKVGLPQFSGTWRGVSLGEIPLFLTLCSII